MIQKYSTQAFADGFFVELIKNSDRSFIEERLLEIIENLGFARLSDKLFIKLREKGLIEESYKLQLSFYGYQENVELWMKYLGQLSADIRAMEYQRALDLLSKSNFANHQSKRKELM